MGILGPAAQTRNCDSGQGPGIRAGARPQPARVDAPLRPDRAPARPVTAAAREARHGAARPALEPFRDPLPARQRAAARPAPRGAGNPRSDSGERTARQTAAPRLDTAYQQSFRADARPTARDRSSGAPASAAGAPLSEPARQSGAAHRDTLHALRDTAAALALGEGRICTCGRRPVPTAAGVEVRRAESGRAYFAGVLSCGSVWTCPVCAAKIARERQQEVSALLARHLEARGTALFLTLTVPHDVGMPLRTLRATVSSAWRKLLGGDRWRRTCDRSGIVGNVRALEVTHGRNGFHPHLHVLLFCERRLTSAELSELHAALFGRWAAAVTGDGLRAPLLEHCPMVPIYSREVADYAAKVSAVLELTRWDRKAGRESGRSPFQILATARQSPADAATWHAWVDGIRGARQLTYSRGLRERYAVAVATDEELASAEVGGETIATFSPSAWRAACRVPMLRADILRAAERGGAADVLELLDSLPYWPPDAVVTLARAGPIPLAA